MKERGGREREKEREREGEGGRERFLTISLYSGEEVDQFNEKMGYATNSHVQHEDDKKAELKKNRENQRRLEEELTQLREKERELVKRIKEGEELQKKSEEVWVEATDQIND